MKILGISNYGNFLHYYTQTTDEILRSLRTYHLDFPQTKDQLVEWEIHFPVFLYSFYRHTNLLQRIITQKEFYDFYMQDNYSFFQDNFFADKIINAMKARIYRTYPSLVRDLHFSVMATEQLTDATIIYNTKLDVEEGIDLLILYNGKYYAVCLYTKTDRAFEGRAKKKFRHIPFSNVNYIELPVAMKNEKKCGPFFMYGIEELELVKKKIGYGEKVQHHFKDDS